MRGDVTLGLSSPTKNFYVVAAILVGSWLATVLVAPLRTFVEAHLLLTSSSIPQLELWAAFTHAFFPRDFLMLVFNVAMLYMFGVDMERDWGLKKWWGVLLAAITFGGMTSMLVAWAFGSTHPVSGFALPISAFVAAYCWRIWNQRMRFFTIELTGRTLLIFFIALDALLAILTLDPTILTGRLVATGIGLAAAEGISNLRMRFTRWRIRRKLRVVKSPESDSKKRDKRKLDDGTWLN
ncbi:MAG: rhomboid family intramembrane serine protease [Myxococcota bacterium]|nr:rhomboid family intramembrane serine protease [Myxococcota bacterium]MEC9440478.1 rhomboid family intramembrane serine protease [Myxococcota bacterium]